MRVCKFMYLLVSVSIKLLGGDDDIVGSKLLLSCLNSLDVVLVISIGIRIHSTVFFLGNLDVILIIIITYKENKIEIYLNRL